MQLVAGAEVRVDGAVVRLEGAVAGADVSRGAGTLALRGRRGDAAVNDLLASSDLRVSAAVDIEVGPRLGPARGTGGAGEPRLVLEAPPLEADEATHVVLVEDEDELRWVFRRPGEQRFVLDLDDDVDASRGVAGKLVRKAVKFLAVKAVKPVAQIGVRSLARVAEDRLRPSRLRAVGPDDLARRSDRLPDTALLGGGPALLLLHGTNSRTDECFGALDRDWLAGLAAAYGGRLFAFDHPTLSVTPADNADELARQLAELLGGPDLEVDVLAHSRGGLVARELAERPRDGIRVRSIVFAGTPNNGTPLCDADHLGDLVDVLTNLATFIPDNPVTGALEVVLELVKDIALEIAYDALPGIKSMSPGGDYLAELNRTPPPDGVVYRAVAADFEPLNTAGLLVKLRDRLFDKVFSGAMNDLVVPTRSVYLRDDGFAVVPEQRVVFDSSFSVSHSTFWTEPRARAVLADWLRADWPVHPPAAVDPATSDAGADLESAVAVAAGPFDLRGALDVLAQLPDKFKDAVHQLTAGPVRAPTRRDPSGPAVVVLPGIMGSLLDGAGRRFWIAPHELARGGFTQLRLGPDEVDVRAVGLNSVYAALAANLAATRNTYLFPFDWRRDIDAAADALDDFIRGVVFADGPRPVHLVAHSMGGLVARSFIRQHPETWTAMDSAGHEAGGRLVMLGTPNRGSYAIPLAFGGEDLLVKGVAAIDLRNDKSAITSVMVTFPGMYDMLPSPALAVDDDHGLLFETASWGRVPVDGALLTRARRFHEALEAAEVDTERLVYVAGDGHLTPARLRVDRGVHHFGRSDRGDGRVLHASGLLDGVRTYYCPAVHGALASDPDVLRDLDELLRTGTASHLATAAAPRRGAGDGTDDRLTPLLAADVDPEPVFVSAARGGAAGRRSTGELAAAMAQATSLYLGTQAEAPRSERTLRIKVTHASLEQAAHPVIVGHYRGLPPEGAEAFLDLRLGGVLTRHHDVGDYPQAVGEALFVEVDAAAPPGGIVIGLGEFAELTKAKLVRSVRRAAVQRALRAMEDPAGGEREFGVSTVLVSTPGQYGLTVEASIAGIVEGVARAVDDLADRDGASRLTELEIIELYEVRATQAAQVATRVDELLPVDLRRVVDLHLPDALSIGRGGRPGLPSYNASGSPWPRVLVERRDTVAPAVPTVRSSSAAPADDREAEPASPPPSGAFAELEFTQLGRGARADRLTVDFDVAKVDRLIDALVQRPDAVAESVALFELLFPHDTKLEVDDTDSLHLLVDTDTAAVPWEVLCGLGVNDPAHALALRTGMLRQLRPDDGAAPTRRSGRPPVGNHALVVGDPPVRDWPRLPGARREAREVAQLLETNGYTVEQLIFDDDADGEEAWVQVQTALVKRPYRIMHFATHGEVMDDHPERTGLLIGGDARLTAVDLRQMSATPDCVFLNACHVGSTGRLSGGSRGSRRVHELAANLALQLMQNGVKAVLAAGWAVDDRAALAFARTVYAQMLSGVRYGEAVHRARVETFDGGRTNTWGAYQCYGDPSFALVSGSSSRRPPAPVSAAELAQRCDVLGVQAGDVIHSDRLKWVSDDLRELDRSHLARFPDVAVYEALGWAYGELGSLADAVWALRAAAEADRGSGRLSLRASEKLSNFEARLAANRALDRPSPLDDEHPCEETPAALFRAAEQRLRRLSRFEATAERSNLLGGLEKKRAATRREDQRESGLRAARDAYHDALLLGLRASDSLSAYSVCLWAQMSQLAEPGIDLPGHLAAVDLLEAQLLLGEHGRSLEAPRSIALLRDAELADALAELPATAEAELAARENALADGGAGRRRPRIDFWGDAMSGDLLVTRAVLRRDGDFGASFAPYATAFRNRSAARDRGSVLDHLRDLHELLPEEQTAGLGDLLARLEAVTIRSLTTS